MLRADKATDLLNILMWAQSLCENEITRSSMFEYLLLKVKINYAQYFAKNPTGIMRLKCKFIHNIKITYEI